MKIVISFPPNIDAINKVFVLPKTVMFCYGDTIYNPYNLRIDHPIMVHEETHEKQQAEMGVEAWWDRYLKDPIFRAEQEKAAYKAQYVDALNYIHKLEKRNLYKIAIATALSSSTYGNCISFKEALLFIDN